MRGVLAHETLTSLTSALIAASPQMGSAMRGLTFGSAQVGAGCCVLCARARVECWVRTSRRQ